MYMSAHVLVYAGVSYLGHIHVHMSIHGQSMYTSICKWATVILPFIAITRKGTGHASVTC